MSAPTIDPKRHREALVERALADEIAACYPAHAQEQGRALAARALAEAEIDARIERAVSDALADVNAEGER
jgi:hypothetical protein